jgi:hypothetical protein
MRKKHLKIKASIIKHGLKLNGIERRDITHTRDELE